MYVVSQIGKKYQKNFEIQTTNISSSIFTSFIWKVKRHTIDLGADNHNTNDRAGNLQWRSNIYIHRTLIKNRGNINVKEDISQFLLHFKLVSSLCYSDP